MKTFNPLNVSSKFAICGLPIRVDTYKGCTFGCKYCFSNNRVICEFDKNIQIANLSQIQRKLIKVFDKEDINQNNLLENLIANQITWHCGGMSDPFQPAEKEYHITKQMIDICNKYNISILFSTKSDNVYDANIRPDLHSFQLSITNVDNKTNWEPNVPSIEKRYKFYKELKSEGYKVGIRIQPFIPNVSNLQIVKMFSDADNFTLEGLKIVPQNKEHKDFVLKECGLSQDCFTQMGLLNLKPELRLSLYKPFIEYFESHNMRYSIADNDMHYIGNNFCCCGDSLIKKSTSFNNTSMIKKYGDGYAKEQIDEELFNNAYRDCKCNHLFTSNRQEGCVTIQDFYDKRFYRKSSPFSPYFQYRYESRI